MESRTIERRAAWIIGFSILTRLLIVFLTHGHWFNTDSYGYIKQAEAIISGHPYGYFPNGYPLIIAFFKIITGDSLSVYLLLFLNILLSSLSVGIAYLIGRKLFGEISGVIIAIVLMLYPNQLNYVRELMSEVPAEFFLMAGMYAFLRHRYFISAVLLMVTCYIRTEFIPVICVLGLILFLRDKKTENLYRLIAGTVVFVSVIAIIRYENIVKPPNNLGENLLFAINKNSHEGLEFSTKRYSQEQINHPIKTYLNFAVQHPSRYLSQRFWSLWELWGAWPGDGNDPSMKRGWPAKLVIGSRFLFFLLALYAVYKNRNRWDIYILLTPVFVITAVHFMFYSTPRYEYVVEPLVIILAVGGLKPQIESVFHPRSHALRGNVIPGSSASRNP